MITTQSNAKHPVAVLLHPGIHKILKIGAINEGLSLQEHTHRVLCAHLGAESVMNQPPKSSPRSKTTQVA